jgi:Uncharacterised nucleotidyltransferase
MPLIYRNLVRGGEDNYGLSRLKGIYRKTWVTNNLLMERTAAVAEALREANVPALFVEGVAIAVRFYPELGLRPTSSIDVFVGEHHRSAALAQLAQTGWHECAASASPDGSHLVDRAGNGCVVRTSLAIDFVARSGRERSQAALWEAAERRTIEDTELLVPAPTDTLLAVCVAHARADGARRVQWLADAKAVLPAEIDWERLLAVGEAHGQSLRLRDAFRYLAELPGPRPPEDVVERLETTKASARERLSYVCTSGAIRGAGALPSLVAEHVAATADESVLRTAASFPRHLRDRWQLSRGWHVPFAAGRRALRVLTTRRGGAA